MNDICIPPLTPDERRLLEQPTLLTAVEAGLANNAVMSADPWARARAVCAEYMVGRDGAWIEEAGDESPVARELQRMRVGLRDVMRWWSCDLHNLDIPDCEADHRPGALLQLAAVTLHRLTLDAPGTGMSFEGFKALLERTKDAAEGWLERAGDDAAVLATGLIGALHAVFAATMGEQAAWACDYVGRLRTRLREARLSAYDALTVWFEAYANVYNVNYPRAIALLQEALPRLRFGGRAPWVASALAIQYFIACMSGASSSLPVTLSRHPDASDPDDERPFSITDFERALVSGMWQTVRPMARVASVYVIALGLSLLGEPGAALRLITQRWSIEDFAVPNGDRARTWRIVTEARLAQGDVEGAREWLARLMTLWPSASQQIAVQQLRLRLGEPDADPVAVAAAAGTDSELAAARLVLIGQAIQQGERAKALSELAALDELSRRVRVDQIRARALRLFQPLSTALPLSARQLEVAGLAAVGMTNKQIGAYLFVSPRTVQSHVRAALAALGLVRRSQFALLTLPTPRTSALVDALTVRQGQVAVLIAANCTNAEIADVLGLSAKTVEKHVHALLRALEVSSRAGIANAIAQRPTSM